MPRGPKRDADEPAFKDAGRWDIRMRESDAIDPIMVEWRLGAVGELRWAPSNLGLTTNEPGRPGYSGADLVADSAGVLDVSTRRTSSACRPGGAMAQLLALDAAHWD
jgi:hypothetical protein